jgi:hypothetical protein
MFRVIADHAAAKEEPVVVRGAEHLYRPAAGKPLPWQSKGITHCLTQEETGKAGSQIVRR